MNKLDRDERLRRNWWDIARHYVKRRDSEIRSYVLYVNQAHENHTAPITAYGSNLKALS